MFKRSKAEIIKIISDAINMSSYAGDVKCSYYPELGGINLNIKTKESHEYEVKHLREKLWALEHYLNIEYVTKPTEYKKIKKNK